MANKFSDHNYWKTRPESFETIKKATMNRTDSIDFVLLSFYLGILTIDRSVAFLLHVSYI